MKKRLLSVLLSGVLLGTLFLGGGVDRRRHKPRIAQKVQRALLFRRARGKPIGEMTFQNR